MTDTQKTLLRLASVLWVIWGLVHFMAGVMVLSGSTTQGFAAIGDATDPGLLAESFAPIVDGVQDQHAWNLAWFGIATVIGGVLVWRQNMTAIWVTAMVGGLADLGYFFFIDLPGHANFLPGTLMTIVSASAILLSFWVWFAQRGQKAN